MLSTLMQEIDDIIHYKQSQQVQYLCLVATGIELDRHNAVFFHVSKIANHVLYVYTVRLSLVLRFQPFYADFVPLSSHLRLRWI